MFEFIEFILSEEILRYNKINMSAKLKLLTERLGGDLTKYDKIGWFWKDDNDNDEAKKGWLLWGKLKRKHPKPDEKLYYHSFQGTATHCYCETPIKNLHLIQHKETKEYYVVGSECIKNFFGDYLRRCIDCNEPNRCHSLRCKKCRRECPHHKAYHDDNSICKKCIGCSSISNSVTSRGFCVDCERDAEKDCIDCGKGIVSYFGTLRCDQCAFKMICSECGENSPIFDSRSICWDCDFKKKLYEDIKKKPSFNSKYSTIEECFKNKWYMEKFLMQTTWFRYKPEYEMYQLYKEYQAKK